MHEGHADRRVHGLALPEVRRTDVEPGPPLPEGSVMVPSQHLIVWYCGRCRKVIRCQPRWALQKGCACKVPRIGHSTKVWQA